MVGVGLAAVCHFALADIALVAPPEGAVLPVLSESGKASLGLASAKNARGRRAEAKGVVAENVFSWTGVEGASTLVVRRKPDGRECVRMTAADGRATVVNLEVATDFEWRVTCGTNASPWRAFSTEPFTPRVVYVPAKGLTDKAFKKKSLNMRDLGGRVGIGGRRIRQGLVYRSCAFNDGACKDGSPARLWIGESEIHYLTNALGVRTDLDLRNANETRGMSASPLGPNVRWVNVTGVRYGGALSESGRAKFRQQFAVFLDRANYPIDIHCKDGRSRTGTLVFELLGLLGASPVELNRDWLMRPFDEASVTPAGDPKAETFLGWYAAMARAYPDAKTLADMAVAYAHDAGVTDAEIAAFREMMLETKEREAK